MSFWGVRFYNEYIACFVNIPKPTALRLAPSSPLPASWVPCSFSAQEAPASQVRVPGAATELNQGFPCFCEGGAGEMFGTSTTGWCLLRKCVSAPQKYAHNCACPPILGTVSLPSGADGRIGFWGLIHLSQPPRPAMCLPAGVPGVSSPSLSQLPQKCSYPCPVARVAC